MKIAKTFNAETLLKHKKMFDELLSMDIDENTASITLKYEFGLPDKDEKALNIITVMNILFNEGEDDSEDCDDALERVNNCLTTLKEVKTFLTKKKKADKLKS